MVKFNRVAAFVLAFVLLAGGALLVAAEVYFPGPYTVTALDGQQYSFSALSTADKLATGAIGLSIFLIGLFLVMLELLGPPSRQQLPLHAVEGGLATVAKGSVEQRLKAVLEQVPGIAQAAPRVHFGRAQTSVDAAVTAEPDVPLPSLCQQAQATVAQTLEHDLGLTPGEIRVRVQLRRRADHGSAPAPVS